jgi:vancomycin permeability regulator SanA
LKVKSRSQNKNSLLAVGILALIYLLIILYLKYDMSEMSIRELRFDYIGNMINMLVALLVLVGSIIITYSKKTIDKKKKIFLITLSVISILLLVSVILVSKLQILHTEKLVFNFPLKKVYTGVLFIFSFFIQIYQLIYVWGLILTKESLFELRSFIRSVAAVLLLMVFSLIFVWNVHSFSESKIGNRTFDYGFIPGAAVYSKGKPSPIFEGRIRKALEVFRKGTLKKIILTGGNAPGEISEGEAAQKYLVNLGVNKKNIVYENHSTTTTEQISYLRMNFSVLSGQDSVLIISDGFHLSRAIQIAKFYKINSVGVASDYSLSFEKTLFYRTRESVALLLFWLFAI